MLSQKDPSYQDNNTNEKKNIRRCGSQELSDLVTEKRMSFAVYE